MSRLIMINCSYCNRKFKRSLSKISSNKKCGFENYCSRSCADDARKKKMMLGIIPKPPAGSHKGFKHSSETRKKMSLNHADVSGKNNPNYKDGKHLERRGVAYKIRVSKEYQRMRKIVLKRDKKCIICGSIKRLEVDHIKKFSNHPELRLNPNNCRTLCHNCHKLITYGIYCPQPDIIIHA